MRKSHADLIRELQLREESERLSLEAISKAAGPKRGLKNDCLGYLVTYFGRRTDLPEVAALIKMLPKVERNLAAMGLKEPVSLQGLPGKWWLAHIDMAVDEFQMETGCGMVTKVASTEDLLIGYTDYYCEVASGPFDRKEDVK